MAESWSVDISDLLIDMPMLACYDDLPGGGDLAAKRDKVPLALAMDLASPSGETDLPRHPDHLRGCFDAQKYTFYRFENNQLGPTGPSAIRVHTTNTTVEVADWLMQEVQKQKRLTTQRQANGCPPTEARPKKRKAKFLSGDDGLLVLQHSSCEVHRRNAKRRRLAGKGLARVEGNLGEALYHPDHAAQAFQRRPFLSGSKSLITVSAAPELERQTKNEKIAAMVTRARNASGDTAQRIELTPKVDTSAATKKRELDPTNLVLRERKLPVTNGDGQPLGNGKRLTVVEASGQAVATEMQHRSALMSVIYQAAALQADGGKFILPLNQPKRKASSHPAEPPQTTHHTPKATIGSLDIFLKTVTEASSGASYEIQRQGIRSELRAQQRYVEEIFTGTEGRNMSEDAHTTKANGTIRQLLEDFEEIWANSHPEVKVPVIANVVDRQIAYLILDVAIKCGDFAGLDKRDLLTHITAVQREGMSRQLIILRAMTECLRQKAQSKSPVVARLEDQEVRLLSSTSTTLKQVLSTGDGSFRHDAQNSALKIDNVTGAASAMKGDESRKGVDDRSTCSLQKTRKPKREAESLKSWERSKALNGQGGAEVALPKQTLISQVLSLHKIAPGMSHLIASEVANLLNAVEAGNESDGTVNPADLLRTIPSWSTLIPRTEPVKSMPVRNERGYMDVIDAFKAHGYNILSEEDRTRDLLRHRQTKRELLGE